MWENVSPETPLALIGCGKMGAAMAQGWIKAGLSDSHFVIIDPVIAHTGLEGVSFSCVFPSLEELPDGINPSIFVLAVKPQVTAAVLPSLAPYLPHDPLILSIAAGVKIQSLIDQCGSGTAVVRAMPNTPAAIGKGVIPLFANQAVSGVQKRISQGLMQTLGKAVWLDSEDQMNAVTALSGSGAAYVFHMVEAMSAAGVTMGLDAELSAMLARETVIGASRLMEKDPRPVRELRQEVTSPGGSTAAGLSELMGAEPNLSVLMRNTLRAAKKRTEEMG